MTSLKQRVLVLVCAIVALTALTMSPAAAQYNPQNFITCTPTTVTPGTTVTCKAGYFTPGTVVTFKLGDTVIGTAIADPTGVATITFTVPVGTPLGQLAVSASGNGFTLSALLQVVSGTPSTTPLPITGSDSTLPLTAVAAGLIVAGGLVLIGARRRRSAS